MRRLHSYRPNGNYPVHQRNRADRYTRRPCNLTGDSSSSISFDRPVARLKTNWKAAIAECRCDHRKLWPKLGLLLLPNEPQQHLRPVYSDTTQLNSTELNSTAWTTVDSVCRSWHHKRKHDWLGCTLFNWVSWVQLSCVAINTPLHTAADLASHFTSKVDGNLPVRTADANPPVVVHRSSEKLCNFQPVTVEDWSLKRLQSTVNWTLYLCGCCSRSRFCLLQCLLSSRATVIRKCRLKFTSVSNFNLLLTLWRHLWRHGNPHYSASYP